MTNILTANELKTKGVTGINKLSKDESEILITVRNKPEYVILPIKVYNRYREYELEIALKESKEDIKNGKFKKESVKKHIERITRV